MPKMIISRWLNWFGILGALLYVNSLFSQNAFVENKGQWNQEALFRLTLPNGAVFPVNEGIVFSFFNTEDIEKSEAHHHESKINPVDHVHFHSYKMSFVGAQNARPEAESMYEDYENYYIGNDSKKWASKARRYRKLTWKEIYPSIDYTLYVNDKNSLQYDFIVNPGGQAENIKLKYEGQDSLYVDKEGKVVLVTSVNRVNELQPYAYQTIEGEKVKIKCNFLIFQNKYLAFQFPDGYNESYPLIIDPVLVFSTYSGSLADNWGFTATFDDVGNAFSGGIVFNTGYPTSLGAFQVNFAGGEPYNSTYYPFGSDIGIIKYSASGTQRIWATYLGGTISEELPHSIVCNRSNDLIIMGTTGSSDFPTTSNAYDNTFHGGTSIVYDNILKFSWGIDIFVTRLKSDGTQLLGSTFVGGSDNDGFNFRDIYLNYIMDGNDSTLYNNYADGARGEVICDESGNIYVGSCTFSSDFPVTAGTFQPYFSGNQDGVVFKLNPTCSQLLWSSYFGGSNDDAIYSLDLDQSGDVYFTGGTLSSNIQTTSGVVQPINPGVGSVNGFIGHITSDGSTLVRSTYWGSSVYDQTYFIRVDKSKNIYVTGQTKAPGNTYIINAAYGTPNSGQFITKFPNNLSSPIWSTAFGTGIGRPNISLTAFSVDYCNRIYVSGWGRDWTWTATSGTKNMEVTANAYQSVTDGQDFYLMVLADDASHLEYATFFGEQNYSTCSYSGHDHVDGGTSRFDKRGNIYQSVCASCGGCNQFPTYPNPGAWSNINGNAGVNENNCNNALFKFSFALPLTVADFQAPNVCINNSVSFTNTSQLASEYLWNFGDGSNSTDANPSHTYTHAGTYNVMLIANNPTSCNMADTIIRPIVVEELTSQTADTSLCYGNNVSISIAVNGNTLPLTYVWDSHNPIQDTINSNLSNPGFSVSPTQSQNYYILASDGLCTISDSVHVEVNRVVIQASPDTSICLNSNATLHANIISTSGTVSYQWSPTSSIISGGNTSSPTVNPQQNTTYYVTATESHQCTTIDSVHVSLDPFAAQFASIQPVLCHNECNGSLQVSVSNSVLPVTYHWSNNQSSSQISNLCAGNYAVTVTDGLGCTNTLQTSFSNPALLEGNIQVLALATCDQYHPNTGSVGTQAWGGNPAYHYHWNTGDTIPILQNLFAGTYSVTITDSHGCDTILSAIINDPSPLQIAAGQQPTSCYGSCDGSVQAYITTQGTQPYNYSWNNNSHAITIDSLCSGVYSVTVTDAEYCVRVQSVLVQQPDSIRPVTNIPPIKCFGDTTFISVTNVLGGTGPYTFLWNTGSPAQSIHGIYQGNYSVVITDANQCKDTTFFNVLQPDLLLTDTTISLTLCTVACNGFIILHPHGGTIPYSYNWSNGLHSSTINDLCEGNYDVTMTDANGCSITGQYSIGNSDYHPPLNAIAQPYVIYHGQSSHLIAQANSNYHFLWNPENTLNSGHIQNPLATPDSTTQYIVQITDGYGCTNIDTVLVTVMDVICSEPYIYVPNAFTPNDDGNNDILYVHADMSTNLYFAIYDRWGECMFETTDASKGWDGKYKGKPLDPAVFVYYLKVTCLNRMQFEKKGNITLLR